MANPATTDAELAHAADAPDAARGGHVDHFDSPARRSEAVFFGMWVFLATEILFFGGLFATYSVYRFQNHDAFRDASRHLDLWLGTLNTLVLLTSSLTMALAVQASAGDRRRRAVQMLTATLVLGGVFLFIKGLEYLHKYHDELLPLGGLPFHWPGENPAGVKLFLSLYLAMTGLHALHMVIGIGLMAIFAACASSPRWWSARGDSIEVLGLYWHFVDLVWIFLFPLLYLVDRS